MRTVSPARVEPCWRPRCARHARLAPALVTALLGTLMLGIEPVAALTFTTSLTPIKLHARPGQVLTTEVRLTSHAGERAARFKADVQDWWRSEDGRQSFYSSAGSLPRSCGPWVSVNPGEASIAGGETLVVRLTVSVPAGAQPGGYWCALTLDEVHDPLDPPADGVGMQLLASVATGIYVYLEPVERAARILGIDLEADTAFVRLRNAGNTPVAIEGRFEFFRPDDAAAAQPLAVAVLPRNTLLTEPVPTGRFAAELPAADILPPGRYVVRVLVDIGLDHYIGAQREIDLVRHVTHER